MTKTTIAIVDDHELMAKALSGLVQKYEEYEVLYEVSNGQELLERIRCNNVPDVVLLDINMPVMNGFETALWLKNNHPNVKVLALSMNDREESIVGMLRNGARGYLLKGCKPSELKQALDAIVQKGFYYTEYITGQLIRSLSPDSFQNAFDHLGFNEREIEFVKWACSDLTYVEIADKISVSPRTIDGYRESVFQKMGVKSRVSMAIEAIRLRIIEV
ncbi:MAG: DNA-binding response regulator [Runella slithyformis]|nr:MAG: DNA-binding response regulator [Runella slithyformis]TAF03658.1 MAG: DNA-binding response regulator [Runella slithyformis]TAF27214.1 MAG: DNA-binding response regulator [Runella slithyformis]TAF45862.1 MAG: DNA-binding response regulator [Runella slithyformis]TAF80689.1 MAG: DNA-binding response regulator [Runella slithyformis]